MIEESRAEIESIRRFDTALYASAPKDGSDFFTQILLAQMRNGKPYLADLDYSFKDDGEIQVINHRSVCPPLCSSLPFRLGRHIHIDSYLEAHPRANYDSPEALKQLVELEFDSKKRRTTDWNSRIE